MTTITIGGVADPRERWRLTRAILDSIQEGAGSHCLYQEHGVDWEQYTHHRLGVTIRASVGPAMPQRPANVDEWIALSQEVGRWGDAMRAALDSGELDGTRAGWNAWQCLVDVAARLHSIGAWLEHDARRSDVQACTCEVDEDVCPLHAGSTRSGPDE